MNNTTVGDIYDFIDSIAPFATQCEWDNAGLMTGDRAQEVTRVMVALDATVRVISAAAERGCQLIVTHHPLIFRGIKHVYAQSPVWEAVQRGLSCVSAHTNLDLSARGVNLCLANALGLEGVHAIEEMEFGFAGDLPHAMSRDEFVEYVGGRLGTVCRASVCGRAIRRVAVVGGSGGENAAEAFALGYDAFVTGEVEHHEFLEAYELDRCLVAAGHFETESVVIEPLALMLAERFPGVEFFTDKENPAPCV